jgi:hypothetical protein
MRMRWLCYRSDDSKMNRAFLLVDYLALRYLQEQVYSWKNETTSVVGR